jgi:hypothetical protein
MMNADPWTLAVVPPEDTKAPLLGDDEPGGGA